MPQYTRREFSGALALGIAGARVGRSDGPGLQGESVRAGHVGSLTDVPGITVGHWTDTRRPTGCTAILFDQAAAAGADYSSSAPAESMGVLLQPVSPVERIHAIFFTGGGMFGVAAAGGVVRFLEEHKVGFDWGTPDLRIPIVLTGAIDDLAVGDPRIRPDADAAYKACAAATSAPVVEGNIGAGAGATVGKMHVARGYPGMKGGIGSSSLILGDVVVAALAVVNAAEDILDWSSGQIVAGARRPDGTFADSVKVMHGLVTGQPAGAVQDPALRQHDTRRRRDQRRPAENRADESRIDGELRRRAGGAAVSYDRRWRSAVRGLDPENREAGPAVDGHRCARRRRRRRRNRARRARAAKSVPGWSGLASGQAG